MMGYRERKAGPALRRHVAALWVWEGTAPPSSYRVLPDGCMDILYAVVDGRDREDHSLTVVGTMTRYLEVSRTDLPLLVGVRFRPAGALPFLRVPAPEMTDRRFPLDELWGEDARRLLERLAECETVSGKLDVLESALSSRLADDPVRGSDMLYASEHIAREAASLDLTDLASELGLSPRQFRRRFEAAVGIGPKRFYRVLRFQRLLEKVLQHGGNWIDLALDHGYYDQAHMIRDFKELTGWGPSEYLAHR